MNQKSETLLERLKAILEGTDLSIAEIRKEAFDFGRFLSAAEKMQSKLGHSLCLAKWMQTSLHLTTGHTNSCYHPPLHRINIDDLTNNPSALHNTEFKKAQRQRMLRGERPEECSYCWRVEATGNLSDRHYRSGEPWAAEHYDKIKTEDPLTWNVNPAYVEVNFSNVCNLQCSYCSPQFSSAWQKEINEHGAYPTSNRHNDPTYFTGDRKPIPNRENNPYVDAFWRWWPELYPNLKHFRMTGGEPLMDPQHYRILDMLAPYGHQIEIKYATNGTTLGIKGGRNVHEYWPKFRSVAVNVSIDGIGPVYNYIRGNGDWNAVVQNVQEIKAIPNVSRVVGAVAVQVSNVLILDKMIEYFLDELGIVFYTNMVKYPNVLSVQVLPDYLKGLAIQRLEFVRDRVPTFKYVKENPLLLNITLGQINGIINFIRHLLEPFYLLKKYW